MRCSVLLPVYNAERYLRRAVESVLAQTVRDLECVVIDDGSTDGSGRVLAELAASDHRLRVITQENAGLIRTLNRAIGEAGGEIFFRMDADDIAEPDRFERQLAYLDAHPECVALGTGALLIDPDDRPLKIMMPPEDHERIDAMGLAGVGAAIFHPTAAIRRWAMEQVGGYHAEYPHAEDVDLFLRLGEVGRLANLGVVGLRYRVHPQSIGYTKRAEQIASARRAAGDAHERRGLGAPSFGEPEREGRDLCSTYCRWGWWALGGGHRDTARRYGLRAIRVRPFRRSGWKLLFCSVRGR